MSTPFLGLRTCIYRIPEGQMAAATEWYAKAFGVQPYFNEPFYVGFEIGGYELGLHPLPAEALAKEGPASAEALAKEGPASAEARVEIEPAYAKASAGKGENIETYWGVAEIQSAFNHLIAVGATTHEPPNNVGEALWVAMVKDPWGNIIGIIENPHFRVK